MLTTKENLKELYEKDFLLWIEKTIKLLSDRQLEDLDYENLIEELATVGKSEIRAFESLMIQIIVHLLLYQYWTAKHKYNAHHWTGEIISFRIQLKRHFNTKTFYNYGISELDSLYTDALKLVKNKTKLTVFPSQCPYTFAQILDENWLPFISE